MTEKQKAILKFLKDGEKKKSEIVKEFRWWYYHNSSKHIGSLLSTMVKRGQILRVKKGVYSLNFSLQKVAKETNQIDNQLNLF